VGVRRGGVVFVGVVVILRWVTGDVGGVGVRLTDRVALGVLTRVVPRDLVDEVLVETGRVQQRVRLLPARVVVYFLLASCLFYGESCGEVMRLLVEGLRWMRSWQGDWRVPTESALCQARQRLGDEPMRVLFERVAVPVAGPGTQGAWLVGRRLVAVDGTLLDCPDTPANVAEFGHTSGEGHPSPFPQARVVALGECGTHACIGAAIGTTKQGERELAEPLLNLLEPDMLLIADAGFYSYHLWKTAAGTTATGTDLLWRVSTSLHLPVTESFPDGSYLSYVDDPEAKKRVRAHARGKGRAPADMGRIVVRVVEYEITNRDTRNETIRLITTMLDPEEVSAVELAAAYHQRWEIESALDELKTHQRGPRRVLRSQKPETVKQEIWALLLTHYALSVLKTEAAHAIDIDPDRISFIATIRVARRQVTGQAAFSPSTPAHPDQPGNPGNQ
jgi:hypothetical protein